MMDATESARDATASASGISFGGEMWSEEERSGGAFGALGRGSAAARRRATRSGTFERRGTTFRTRIARAGSDRGFGRRRRGSGGFL